MALSKLSAKSGVKIKMKNGTIYTIQEFADKYSQGKTDIAIGAIELLIYKGSAAILNDSENNRTDEKSPSQKSISDGKQAVKFPGNLKMREVARCSIHVERCSHRIEADTPLKIVKDNNHYKVELGSGKEVSGEITYTFKPLLKKYPYESLHAYTGVRNNQELSVIIYADFCEGYLLDGKEITRNEFISKFNLDGKTDEVINQLMDNMLKSGVLKRIQYYPDGNKMLTRDEIIKKYNLSGQNNEFIDIFINGLTSSEIQQSSIQRNDYAKDNSESKAAGGNIDPVELLNRGVEEKRKGNYSEALKLYKMSEQIDCTSPMLYLSMGKVYYILGRYKEAADSYVRSLQLSGDNDTNVLMHLGHALWDSNGHPALVEEYRSSIDPYFEQYGTKKYHLKLTINDIEKYDSECIEEAYRYIRKRL